MDHNFDEFIVHKGMRKKMRRPITHSWPTGQYVREC